MSRLIFRAISLWVVFVLLLPVGGVISAAPMLETGKSAASKKNTAQLALPYRLAAAEGAEAAETTYSISGRVTDLEGNGVSGVTISATLDAWRVFLPQVQSLPGSGRSPAATLTPTVTSATVYTVITDAEGRFTFTALPRSPYTLRAEKTGIEFAPPLRSVTPPESGSQDFQAYPCTDAYLGGSITDGSSASDDAHKYRNLVHKEKMALPMKYTTAFLKLSFLILPELTIILEVVSSF